ncbi:MAG TPA: hypothetical protein VGH22_23290 [Candidatus Binatia bacterium]|jgi:hypothetical protein
MSHAKSLRVIGQCLEYAHIATFELEKYGPQYMLWSDAVNGAGETALRNLLNDRFDLANETRHHSPKRVFVFSQADIARLDAQAQRQRKNRSTQATPLNKIVSHGLRILGEHLDRIQANAFRIEWLSGSLIMDHQRLDGTRSFKRFTFEEIHRLDLQPRLRRSSLYLFPPVHG